ncbi:uncharacterized protein LOC127248923 [Andrographis paniculata]|uniref:uncharacterized protein LOC127248923 n=1 Tax=Andrographis paniculata TaxID=175694 RepID=UPI0021E7962D|nr:uncharacterized protein LOC127248923 [Andrographis paniculata]
MSNRCLSFTASRDSCYRFSFSGAGLRSTTADLGDGTVVHCWAPKAHKPKKPTLILIHGLGANAMWQWNDVVSPLALKFNVYVPDLIFFGDSYTTRSDRTEAFQASCVMRAVEAIGAAKPMRVVGLSYGGFVAYSMAAQFPAAVDRVVLGCAGVCLEEEDMAAGMFSVKSVDEAIDVLLPQTPDKLRELVKLSFYKPVRNVPSCFLADFIDVMCTENLQERKELIYALHKDRKLSDLPKISQPTLIIWGEHDRIFPLELGHRLKRYLEHNAEIVVLKNAGHAINMEKTKEFYRHIKSFVSSSAPSATKPARNINGDICKVDDEGGGK